MLFYKATLFHTIYFINAIKKTQFFYTSRLWLFLSEWVITQDKNGPHDIISSDIASLQD